ncbi:MAG: hypothetical protein U0232_15270 [Thermomicrobiales bacterium]
MTLPITLVGNLIQSALDQGMPWLDYILGFPTAVWGIALAVISLRAGMRLSTRGAIVTILIAVAIGAVIIGLLTCVAVGYVLAGQVRQSPEMEAEGWLAVVLPCGRGCATVAPAGNKPVSPLVIRFPRASASASQMV